jgi:hypothetical protein
MKMSGEVEFTRFNLLLEINNKETVLYRNLVCGVFDLYY